jgi:hypothetical protein
MLLRRFSGVWRWRLVYSIVDEEVHVVVLDVRKAIVGEDGEPLVEESYKEVEVGLWHSG